MNRVHGNHLVIARGPFRNAGGLVRLLVVAVTLTAACQPEGSVTSLRGGIRGAVTAAPQTITIVPTGDIYLGIDSVWHGNLDSLNVYTWPDDTIANAIVMKFDLSSIPAGATISSATLNLNLFSVDTFPVDSTYTMPVQQIVHFNPDLTQASGYRYDGVHTWTPNTCCRFPGYLAQADILAPVDSPHVNRTLGWKQWNVTSIVQGWFANSASNLGLLLNSDRSKARDHWRFFYSTRNANSALWPYLSVTYITSAAPWIEENFSQYTSQTDLISTPRTSNGVGSWVTGGYQYPGCLQPGCTPQAPFNQNTFQRIFLDQAVGYAAGGLTQSMRYDFPSMTDRVNGVYTPEFDYTIRLGGLQFPTAIGAGQDVWYEWVVKFSPTFNTNVGAGFAGHSGDYKFMFLEPLGGGSRTELKSGTEFGAAPITWGTGSTFSTTWDINTVTQDSHGFNTPASVWDGQWHVYRAHAKISTTTSSNDGLWRVWMDGVVYENDVNISYGTLTRGELWPGNNNNVGPSGAAGQVISMWWGRIRVWNTDPGWGG